MSDTTPERLRLTMYDFTVCLLAALARKHRRTLVTPWCDRNKEVDAAVSHAWKYLEDRYDDVFDCRFAVYTHPVYGDSGDWTEAVLECEYHQHFRRITDYGFTIFELKDTLQETARTIHDDFGVWDTIADAYLDVYEKREPVAP